MRFLLTVLILGVPMLADAACLLGTNRNDVIVGTAKGECIAGRAGHDRINGVGGNDRILGGSGRDRLTGGSGADEFGVDCGVIRPVPEQSTFDTINDYWKRQGDFVQVPGNPTNWVVGVPHPSSGLRTVDRVVVYYTRACPDGTGLFVLRNHASISKSSVVLR